MFYGWRVVAGAFLAQLFVVGFYTYAVSLLVEPVREEFGANLVQVMYSLTLSTFLGLFLAPLAGSLIDRVSVRWLMTAGTLVFGGGLIAVSHSTSITSYIVLFALTTTIANNFASSMCSSAVIARWFSASRGRALGIAAIGTSVGGVVIPALVSLWIEQSGWRDALQNLGLAVLLIMLPVVVITIRGRPDDVGLEPEPGHGSAATDHTDLDMKAIAANPRFWYIGLSLGLLFSAYTAILANLSPYATNLGESAERASSLIMVVALAGFAGKLLFGFAADKFSLKAGLWAAQLLVILGFVTLAQEPTYPLMVLASALVGLAAGGMLPVWGAMTAHAFGLASYGRAMGLMGPLITLCIMPAFPLVGRLFDLSGSYVSSLYLFAGVTVVSAALLLPLNLDQPVTPEAQADNGD
jgi:MFS family permease